MANGWQPRAFGLTFLLMIELIGYMHDRKWRFEVRIEVRVRAAGENIRYCLDQKVGQMAA